MSTTRLTTLRHAAGLAEIVEQLEATNPNCGSVSVQSSYGRSADGFGRLMEFIASDVQSRFGELRQRAIDEARADYERVMEELRSA